MQPTDPFSTGPWGLRRRSFLRFCTVGAAGLAAVRFWARKSGAATATSEEAPALEYLTRDDDFRNIGRGKPPPHQLSPEQRRAVGLMPETWRLEVVPDPASNAKVERPLSREAGSALTWEGLMRLAETRAVRFLSVMSCTNLQGPLGMGWWEGVPLRQVIWMAGPSANVRRVFYHGYHHDDPTQRFQSSLTLDRVLEEPPGELPVMLCYKLNGQWLSPKRGAPVRMIVPGLYGNKSVKWLQRIVLTNQPQLNDTYAEWNNDTESALKTCAAFLHVPEVAPAGQAVVVTGVAQVGQSGLSRIQFWLHPQDRPWPPDDPHFTRGEWQEAAMLPAPKQWGGGLPDGPLPPTPLQFDPSGKPLEWPLRHTIVHWTARLDGLRPGRYDLRCRTIDARGHAQPMPRPLPKSGRNSIARVTIEVVG